jgi:hypothetical protein
VSETRSTQSLAATALALIGEAFADRAPPSAITDSMQLSDAEHAAVTSFEGMRWRDVGFDQVAAYADAVFWFSPQAFCYYLPGFLAAGLRDDRRDSNAYDTLTVLGERADGEDR